MRVGCPVGCPWAARGRAGPPGGPAPSPSVANERTMAARRGSSGQRSASGRCPATNESLSSTSCWMVRSSSTRPRSRAACAARTQWGREEPELLSRWSGWRGGIEARVAWPSWHASGLEQYIAGIALLPQGTARPSKEAACMQAGGRGRGLPAVSTRPAGPGGTGRGRPPRTFHISRPRALSCSATLESPPVMRDLMCARRSSQGMCTAGTSPTSPRPCSSAVCPPSRVGAPGAAAAAAVINARRACCLQCAARGRGGASAAAVQAGVAAGGTAPAGAAVGCSAARCMLTR